jgi:pimeloyl-ACP methyl ester carboxylesterase
MDEIVVVGWRRLAVSRWGATDGEPVFLLHGTPGSRIGVRPSETELRRLGVTLITYDRPGYGLSDPWPGRVVADAADDVAAIADRYRYDKFAVVGRSGGGPHALACAALLADRVTRVAALVTLAPYGAEGLDWSTGMVTSNRIQYLAATRGRAALASVLFPRVMALRFNPDHLLRDLDGEAPRADQVMLSDSDYRYWTMLSMSEAVRQSMDGWAADNLAFTRPWGFDPASIQVPTLLWHGVRDVFSPVTHAQWLASRIRGALLHLVDDSAHLRAAAVQMDAICWLLRGGAFPACRQP